MPRTLQGGMGRGSEDNFLLAQAMMIKERFDCVLDFDCQMSPPGRYINNSRVRLDKPLRYYVKFDEAVMHSYSGSQWTY